MRLQKNNEYNFIGMKSFSFGAVLTLFLLVFNVTKRPADYVLLEYGGVAVDKAVPIVAFSTEEFDRMTIGFGPAFIINKCEYLSICDAIKENNNTQKLDTTAPAYYKFWVVRNNEKELFGSFDIESVKQTFEKVTNEIQNKSKMVQISRILQDIIRQIK